MSQESLRPYKDNRRGGVMHPARLIGVLERSQSVSYLQIRLTLLNIHT